MKRNQLFIPAVLFAMTIAIIGCKEDEKVEPVAKKNFLAYDANEYLLASGMLAYYGDPDAKLGTYNFDIMLFSSGITYNATNDELSGQGDLIVLELFSSSETQLVPGTYVFDSTGSYAANSFDFGFFAVNFAFLTQTGQIEKDITGGNVIVGKSGDQYEVTIDVIADDGKKVTGYYKGSLQYVDYSLPKKKISFLGK